MSPQRGVRRAWPRQAEMPLLRVENRVTAPVSLGKEPRPKGSEVLLESVLVSSGCPCTGGRGACGSFCTVELPASIWRDLELTRVTPLHCEVGLPGEETGSLECGVHGGVDCDLVEVQHACDLATPRPVL